jgi:hypothetical protein
MFFVILSHARSARQPLWLFTCVRINLKSAVWRFDGSRPADSAKIAGLPCCLTLARRTRQRHIRPKVRREMAAKNENKNDYQETP